MLDRRVAAAHGHDLRRQPPGGLCRRRLAMAAHGELLLVAPRDLVRAGQVLGGLAHGDVGLGVSRREAGVGHRVEAHDRHAGHRFDPGADEGFAGAHGDRAGRHVHRLHRRAAEPVDGRGRGALRQPGQEADQARDVQALLALGEGAADDHVLDRLRVDPRALDQRGDDLGRELVRPDAGEAALVGRLERRAGIARDHDRPSCRRSGDRRRCLLGQEVLARQLADHGLGQRLVAELHQPRHLDMAELVLEERAQLVARELPAGRRA